MSHLQQKALVMKLYDSIAKTAACNLDKNLSNIYQYHICLFQELYYTIFMSNIMLLVLMSFSSACAHFAHFWNQGQKQPQEIICLKTESTGQTIRSWSNIPVTESLIPEKFIVFLKK